MKNAGAVNPGALYWRPERKAGGRSSGVGRAITSFLRLGGVFDLGPAPWAEQYWRKINAHFSNVTFRINQTLPPFAIGSKLLRMNDGITAR